ncbi:TraA family conjugative transfer protein [Vibrio mediterranei]|uniref:TraA family conjugative transfer protein n=1 Tax=Vibrio mediterranei TaxID=689 RepID=UPI0040678EB7
MEKLNLNVNKIELTNRQMNVLFLCSLLALMFIMNSSAMAGTDATFDTWVTQMTDWLEGSLGKGIAIGFVLIGIVVGMAQQSLMSFAIGVGAALGLNYTPSIMTGMFGAAL